jgi:AcrR family transcriptional regulator
MASDAHTDANPMPRRSDRRRARTRAALLEAGRALYALRGLDAVSVDEIVAAADVAKGSFYNHFRDKDGFAREIAGGVRRQAERTVEAANAGVTDPGERLARALCVFIRFAIDHRDSAQVLWRLNSGATWTPRSTAACAVKWSTASRWDTSRSSTSRPAYSSSWEPS